MLRRRVVKLTSTMSNIFVKVVVISFIVCAVSAKSSLSKSRVDCSKNNKILWPDYSDKKFYYECISEDSFVRRPCPSKTVFNYYTQQCTWPEDWLQPPELDNFIEPLEEVTPTADFSPSCLISELHLFWPDPTNHQDYFLCTGIGMYERLSCLDREIFEFLVQTCIEEPPTTDTLIPKERRPSCLEHELHLAWPDPWYFEYYFICTGIGNSELKRCRDGLVFVFMKQMCDIGGAQITQTTTPMTTTMTTTMTPTTVTPPTAGTEAYAISYPMRKCLICWRPTCERFEMHYKWPDFDSKRNYFKCLSEGVLTLKTCVDDLVFDFHAQKCIEEKIK